MVIQTGDNKFGVAKWIVDPVLGLGTHTTIQSAIDSASEGDDIFIRPGTYTEDLILKSSVNLVSFPTDNFTPNVQIIGKCTYTEQGVVNLSGMRLQTNGDFAVEVSGSENSFLNLFNCYLRCTDNTGVSFTSSGGSSQIIFNTCRGDITTTGIAYFSHSSTGTLHINSCDFTNTGDSTTASTISDGTLSMINSRFISPITTSGSSVITLEDFSVQNSSTNVTSITHNSTGVNSSIIRGLLSSGTASALSIGAGATLVVGDCTVSSSNTNAVTGLGTLVNAGIFFTSTSSLINTSSQTARNLDVGGISFNGGVNVLNTYSTGTFTPGIAFGGGTTGITYSTQSGSYTKIGRMVFCKINITLSSKGSSTGTATITGLPFTVENDILSSAVSVGFASLTLTANYTVAALQTNNNSTSATLIQYSNTGLGAALITDVECANTTAIFANFFYFAAS